MSPKLYEYLGIVIKIWSDEHSPIHVHAIGADGAECKVSFYFKNSQIEKITYTDVKGKKPLTLQEMKKLQDLVNQEKHEIVNAWIKFVVLKGKVRLKRITQKIK